MGGLFDGATGGPWTVGGFFVWGLNQGKGFSQPWNRMSGELGSAHGFGDEVADLL